MEPWGSDHFKKKILKIRNIYLFLLCNLDEDLLDYLEIFHYWSVNF